MRLTLAGARALFVALGLALISGCSGTPSAPSDPGTKSSFENFLVVGITADYNNRTQFERMLVSHLRIKGAAASAYHSVTGGNKPIVKEEVIAAIQEHGFDAVLVIQRLDSDIELEVTRSRTDIDAEPVGGNIVNLFRSDYKDYTTPGSIDLATQTTLAIQLYSVETEDIVYKFDHQTKRGTNLGLMIDQTAETIANRLDRQDLIAN